MRYRFALILIGLLFTTMSFTGSSSVHLPAGQPVTIVSAIPRLGAHLAPVPGIAILAKQAHPLLCHSSGHQKKVTLTFDDGPDVTYTPEILTILNQYHLHATFFNLGQNVQAHPQVTRMVYAAGHTIGNHSWNHTRLTALSPTGVMWQLESTNHIIQQTIGIKPTLMRPPYNSINNMVRMQIEKAGLQPVLGDVDSLDWQRPGVNVIVQTTLRETGNTSIIVMHDGGGDRTQTVGALPLIIQALEQRGYAIVPIQQLSGH
ncbi:polysaccharide deacetylase family protein [Dictyobacter aurantiacus]|uniref:NodB homology domain-containing protein n=1 Tax=Dictyobacter aurantiacus TaxID=1936993 RepID=A0A401ZPS5_9CHLR|nr:polysaccharide deacetylase family protein [Dictyobacter aurantiacus]GCE08908.1 hypothetical protein KDAU_62370 [Dictyobacter aurantiacus]